MFASPLLVLSIGLAAAGSITDIFSKRLPNWLTVGALLIAIALRLFGVESVGSGFIGAGIAFAVAIPLFAIRAIGGGDVKYLTAFGAVLGAGRIGSALVLVSIAGGVLALGLAIARGRGRTLIADCARLAVYSISLGFLGSRRMLSDAPVDEASPRIPLGVAIAAGCVLVWFL